MPAERDTWSDPEKVYDDWFKRQPKRAQAELRAKGLAPHSEQPSRNSSNVFPVIQNHRVYGVEPDFTTATPEPEREDFISSTELRHRMQLVFEALEQYASHDMRTYLRFIRALLGGHASGISLSSLAKDLGISKQAVAWRSRRILAALGRVAQSSALAQEIAASEPEPAQPASPPPATPAGTVAIGPYLVFREPREKPQNYTGQKAQKTAKKPRVGGYKASLCATPSQRVVNDPASFVKKPRKSRTRYPARATRREKRV